jgi:hypothetical protein
VRPYSEEEHSMSVISDLGGQFEAITEAEADSRGRVTIARAGGRPGRRYRVYANVDGLVVLEPVVSIPEREMLVWENPALAEQIRDGIDEAEAGETVDLGSFAQYLTEDSDEE